MNNELTNNKLMNNELINNELMEPNDFIFHGALGSMYKQIGNAVAVDLAYQIGRLIKKEL